MTDEERDERDTDDELLGSIEELQGLAGNIEDEATELDALIVEARQTPVNVDRLQMYLVRALEYLRNSTLPILSTVTNATAQMGIELMAEMEPDDSQLLPEDSELISKALISAAQIVAEFEAAGDPENAARCKAVGALINQALVRIKDITITDDDEDDEAELN